MSAPSRTRKGLRWPQFYAKWHEGVRQTWGWGMRVAQPSPDPPQSAWKATESSEFSKDKGRTRVCKCSCQKVGGHWGLFRRNEVCLQPEQAHRLARRPGMRLGAPCDRSLASLTAGDPSFSGSDAQAQGSPRYQRRPSVGDVGSRPAGGAVACVCSLPQPRSASKDGRQGPREVSSQTCGRSRLLRSGQCLGACVVACFGGAC